MTEVEELKIRLAAARAELALEILRDFYEPDEAVLWMQSPQSLLNGKKPCEMLVSHEEWGRVYAQISALRDGAFI